MNQPARCGTPSGHNRHWREGERPCDACVRAKAEYDKRRLSAPALKLRNRLHAKAQALALRELKNENLDRYRELYAAYKRALLGEG